MQHPLKEFRDVMLQDNVVLMGLFVVSECYFELSYRLYGPRSEKTGLRGFRPGPTQTGLYNHRRWPEA